MKPDKVTCLYCGKIIQRGKYCSDAHRMAYNRNPNKSEQTRTEPKSEQKVEQTKLTPTDQTFYDRAMKDFGEPYYRFGGPLHEEICLLASCGKKFETTLSALRFCCYDHYKGALEGRK